jgi:hypothetical protein
VNPSARLVIVAAIGCAAVLVTVAVFQRTTPPSLNDSTRAPAAPAAPVAPAAPAAPAAPVAPWDETIEGTNRIIGTRPIVAGEVPHAPVWCFTCCDRTDPDIVCASTRDRCEVAKANEHSASAAYEPNDNVIGELCIGTQRLWCLETPRSMRGEVWRACFMSLRACRNRLTELRQPNPLLVRTSPSAAWWAAPERRCEERWAQ